ncbi:hypothetical protein SELMODRAFT_446445 [Selaginella moellendorffii]|uniref:4-coumarate--CoA ligase n=1 Tax=Selaginella moellendorffii TaxID=88036 RepID=D8SRG0_SELML|nr:4-coumarate--CoA ligase-like 7 [Selaginella moellendorffii]EFJ13043.1 hypothetical protein SELMODRAFT_446445 [Selaginella moellendorffii]|eukprot:XP_002985866.1 4-coumarate--CoA ligase-like 7 [Selaginella moellendorffii]
MASVFDPATGIYSSCRPALSMPSPGATGGIVQFLLERTSDPGISSKLALVDAITGERVTFSQLRRRISVIAQGLIELGVRRGDVVLILSPNSIQFVESFLAVIFVGAILTTVNPLNTAEEIAKQARDSSPSLVITTLELADKVQRLDLPSVIIDHRDGSVLPPRSIPYSSLLRESPIFRAGSSMSAPIESNLDDTVALLYSSGTTGVSKGVMLSHRNFLAAAGQVNMDAEMEGRENDVLLVMLPLFHIFGLAVSYASLQRSETVVILPRFEFLHFLKSIQDFRVTQLPLVPPVAIALAKHAAVADYDLSSIKNVISGAAPLGKEIMETCSRRLPLADIRQGYGLTESTGLALLTLPREDPRFMGAAGTLVSGTEAMVVDPETCKPVPPQKSGELWLRGQQIMKGYLNNPTATASTIDKNGWLHTGDLVYVNQGRFFVLDRMKELIKYKGFQVAPAELEALLLSHPSLLDAAVVPLADEEAGQVPIAYVVKKPNATVDESNVLNFIAKQVAPYKRLRRVSFIDAIPKSAAGKILRRELTALPQSKL